MVDLVVSFGIGDFERVKRQFEFGYFFGCQRLVVDIVCDVILSCVNFGIVVYVIGDFSDGCDVVLYCFVFDDWSCRCWFNS